MPIAEIINEIDAYLSRLRQARELLSGRMTEAPKLTEAPKKRVPRRKRKVMPGKADPTLSSRRRADENKSRSNHPVSHLKKVRKSVDASTLVPKPVADNAADSGQLAIEEPKRTMEQAVVITRLPARGRISSTRSVRQRTAKPAADTKPDAIKPAIALAGPLNTRIVVVSAEQAQRQRELASHPVVRRPRQPASGLSGRLAFEALFKDEPAKTSGR